MKIVFEHDGIIPVKTYGGTERILYWLMKELVIQGHQVYLIGNPLSDVKSIGVTLIPREKGMSDWRSLIPAGVDVIHLFCTPSFAIDDYPVMVTIHGNGKRGEKYIKNTAFLSAKHAANHGSSRFVYNGLDFDEYPFDRTRANGQWNNFLFLAKASWKVKNLKDCMRACKKEKKHLQIAGGRKFSLSRYMHSHGMVDINQKLDLIRSVDALLWPVRWHEPFGVAVVEAFTQGVPVIASSYGSLPELIKPEVGILCNSYDEFAEAVAGQKSFDPEQIRSYAENNFSCRNMANGYLQLYQEIIDGKELNESYPEFQGEQEAQDLLPF